MIRFVSSTSFWFWSREGLLEEKLLRPMVPRNTKIVTIPHKMVSLMLMNEFATRRRCETERAPAPSLEDVGRAALAPAEVSLLRAVNWTIVVGIKVMI